MKNTTHPTTSGRISVELATDAVIAAYIHEISTRHRADGDPLRVVDDDGRSST